jgi:hypothetical protein
MSFTPHTENVSVSANKILAGVVLNQCFLNVLQVHEFSPLAKSGTANSLYIKLTEPKVANRDFS